MQPELVRTLPGAGNELINVIAWSPDGRRLAVGSYRHIRVWDVTTDVFADFPVTNSVYSLAWSPDGKSLASGHYGMNQVLILDPETGRERRRLGEPVDKVPKDHDTVLGIAWSPITAAIAVTHMDGFIEIWSSNTWKLLGRLPVRRGSEVGIEVGWAPDGILLGTAELEESGSGIQ